MSDTIEARAFRWVCFGETGVSSMAILGVMTGNKPDDGVCYPHDAGDLGRCIALLDLIPEWRARLEEMGAVGAEWAALVKNWTEIERLYRLPDSYERTTHRMREILEPIEMKRPGFYRLSKSASMYFKPGES